MNISLTIPGNPVGKQRARVCRTGHAFTPAKTVNYEALVKQIFAAKYPDFMPMSGPVRMILSIWLMPSKETQRKIKKSIARIYPIIKPDADNILKIVADALSGLAFVDDKQIISVYAEKKYSLRPCVEVILAEP
jgi:Holliday junction resolvase RusA-like endonuclease